MRDVAELPSGRHLMPDVVVDTHAIAWYLSSDPRLSGRATEALDSTTAAGDAIYVPSICLMELTYLIERAVCPPSHATD